MTYLVAAVMLVGALGALNLLLLLGVLRRLREQSARLASADGTSSDVLLAPGTRIPAFSVRTVDGTPVDEGHLDPGTVVAFFSPSCQPCKDLLPAFIDYASTAPGDRERTLAVVSGDPAATADMVAALSPLTRVVIGEDATALVGAFRNAGFPSVYVMGPDGTVARAGHTLSVLLAPTPA